jgi:25S rRNA (uracil2843-N3)-methyltransferase
VDPTDAIFSVHDSNTPSTTSEMKEKAKKKDSNSKNSRRLEDKSQTLVKNTQSTPLPLELQQLVLNIFKHSLLRSGSLSSVREKVQEIKQCLYNRDFAAAFGKEEYLEAYAFRWSPSRALAYLSIFCEVMELVRTSEVNILNSEQRRLSLKTHGSHPSSDAVLGVSVDIDATLDVPALVEANKPMRAVCIGGGGGAEVVALAAWVRLHKDTLAHVVQDSQPVEERIILSALAVDIADWTSVISALELGIYTPPTLSKYASEAIRATNKALLTPDSFGIRFERQDVLNPIGDGLDEALRDVDLVTIMFTLNELFSCSVAKTTSFLLNLTEPLRTGALLVVVDSPGSYSTVVLGTDSTEKGEKKYPMKWLLDHTLLELAGNDAGGQKQGRKWKKVIGDDSRWFRLEEGLQYPVGLENMRYQMHVFRKL